MHSSEQDPSHLPKFKRVLVLAPHTDDAELGCGGSISRFLEMGSDVYAVALSGCEASVPSGSQKDQLRKEFAASAKVLGLGGGRAHVHSLPVREFSYHRQEILDELIKLRKTFAPDAVLLPSGSDVHQDHRVVHEEGIRAFKETTLLGYELPWNELSFSAGVFISLGLRHIQHKWQALQCYGSQIDLKRPYFSWEFISALARVRGVQVHSEYAEAFEAVRIKW